MPTQDLDGLPLPDLIDRTLIAACCDPTAEDEHRWDLVHALRRRREPVVFEHAATRCRSAEPLLRTLGADVLAQLHADDYRADDQDLLAAIATLRDA